jgi:hypothetical protein
MKEEKIQLNDWKMRKIAKRVSQICSICKRKRPGKRKIEFMQKKLEICLN